LSHPHSGSAGLKIEQDWQIASLSQLIADSVEDRFAVLREAAEDQDRFGRDGVDDISDLLVVEQEVDELRDLNVIDGDLRLVLRCDD
jgi:hypothetical protein